MLSIQLEDVSPLQLDDLVRLNASASLEEFVRVLLASAKTSGPIGASVRPALLKLVPLLHQVAFAQLRELLPQWTIDLLAKQDFKQWGLWVMSDGTGNFACVLEGRHALIGSREEIARILSLWPSSAPQKTRGKAHPHLRLVS